MKIATDRIYAVAPFAVAAALLAAIVHLVSVLLTPAVAPRNALARLVQASASLPLTEKGVLLLPRAAPGREVLPFEDPAMAAGACVFDLAKGPLRIRAPVSADQFLGLSLHQASGVTFQALNDRVAAKGVIEVVVGDQRQIDDIEAEDPEDAVVQEVRIVSPATRGFALIRALAKRPSDYEAARALVAGARCSVVEE